MTAKNPVQAQMISAIKYIKADFPTTFESWKQQLKGLTQFEKHLNTIQYSISNQKYSSLKGKIFDELLIKLRFIAKNQSFLQNFQVFLLQRFIRLIVRQLSNLYNLSEVYSSKQTKNRDQVKKELWQRYVIFVDCFTSILKYCFNTNVSNQRQENSPKGQTFTNQMILKSSSQSPKEQIKSKGFVAFVLQVLSQKLEQITKYEIIPPIKVYPEVFSVLSEGFINFKGGSKVLELIGDILNKLILKNIDNIWNESGKRENGLSKLQNLGRQMRMVMSQNKQNSSSHDKEANNKLAGKQDQKKTNEASFSDMSKQRLLLFVQKLLQKLGYQSSSNQSLHYNTQCVNSVQTEQFQSGNKRAKLSKFIIQLMLTLEKGCFDIVFEQDLYNHTINARGKLNETDERILISLVILSVEFIDQSQRNSYQASNIKLVRPFSSSLMTLLSLHIHTHPILSSIHTQLQQIFMGKFKLLINRNKTISSSKTSLLKQLSKLIKFIDFQSMTHDDFQSLICLKLKELFTPNQKELNKPMIIAIDHKTTLSGHINGQAVPLTDLEPHHSFVTYPVTLPALYESMRFQEYRHVLDEVKLFGWFQYQEINLREFKQIITSMEIRSLLELLEYFMTELLQRKLQQTTAIYSLQMSLSDFYCLLINYFLIDTILNPNSQNNLSLKDSNNLLSIATYNQHKQLYTQSLLPKLRSLYSLIMSNSDIKRLLISTKEEQLLVFYHLRIFYSLSRFFLAIDHHQIQGKCLQLRRNSSNSNKFKILYKKSIIAEHLILNLSQSTYLLKLLVTSCLLEFAAPLTLNQSLRPLQSTLIHRNAGSSLNNKVCNLQFMRNLIQISVLSAKSAEQLAQIYLSKCFITNPQANSVISLIFIHLCPQTMRKCILSIRNWPIIFSRKHNIELLNNQPLLSEAKEELFHANDGDNVTVSNALGVIVLQLNEKWTAQLEFSNPRKQILIDAMVNLIGVNDKLIFWKRFFFQQVLIKLCSILKEIQNFVTNDPTNANKSLTSQQQKGRRHILYQRIHSKIFRLMSQIPVEHYKYSTQINNQIRQNLQTFKSLVQKQHIHLKKQCFVYQRYEQYLDKYKQANTILDKIEIGLKFKEYQSQNQANQNYCQDAE